MLYLVNPPSNKKLETGGTRQSAKKVGSRPRNNSTRSIPSSCEQRPQPSLNQANLYFDQKTQNKK